jgi:hypothetical protein
VSVTDGSELPHPALRISQRAAEDMRLVEDAALRGEPWAVEKVRLANGEGQGRGCGTQTPTVIGKRIRGLMSTPKLCIRRFPRREEDDVGGSAATTT